MAEDLNQLCDWLSTVGIEHVVCASGPGGGRHVWVALTAGGVDAATVSTLAKAMATQLPTLDISPLTNPATGAVRPPGAPHRTGGTSTILRGDMGGLLRPTTTEDDIHTLLDLVGLPTHAPPTRIHRRNTLHDSAGQPHLAGPRRPLPVVCRAALETPLTAGQDASARAWVILLGAVRARWRHQDIAHLVEDANASPGLEHFRSSPHVPASRQPRPSEERRQLIARQWARAVDHITQASDLTSDTDPTWDHRVTRVVDAVRRTQRRADASPGRWSRPGGAADRRVLDRTCAITLTALRDDVALDIRSTALATGLSRETARYALVRLRADGWVEQVAAAHGTSAATWRLPAYTDIAEDPQEPTKNAPPALSTGEVDQGRPHVDPPPCSGGFPALTAPAPEAASLTRQAWLTRLGSRLGAQAHDIWLPRRWGGLGHGIGRTYALLEGLGTTDVDTLSEVSGNPKAIVRRHLELLATYRLSVPRRLGRTWRAGSRRHRTTASQQLGGYGRATARARTYATERVVWAWWQAELQWMHTRRRDRAEARGRYRRRAPGPGQYALPLPSRNARERHGPYPRTREGRADHESARAQLAGQRPSRAS